MGEEGRLHAAQDHAPVGVELLPSPGKARLQLFGTVHCESQELVLSRPLEHHQLHVLVVLQSPPHELHLVTRLSLQVEDLLPLAAYLHLDFPGVVPVDALPLLDGDAEPDTLGSRSLQLEADAGHHRFAVRPQLDHLLR